MFAFSNYIKPSNKKYSIDLKSIDENTPSSKDTYKLANPNVTFDNDPAVTSIPLAKERTIDPYEEKEHDIFKAKPLSYKAFDDLLIGFSPEPIKTPALANNDTKAMFGVVSGPELMLSNLETQAGTSNKLNTLLRQKETGDSIDNIKASDAQIGPTYDNVYQNSLKAFMKDYNELHPTTDADELKLREVNKTKTIKALKEMTEEQKTKAMIRAKRFMPKKTVIQPVVPVEKQKIVTNRKKGETPLRLKSQAPVKEFYDSTRESLNSAPTPTSKTTTKPRSLRDIFLDIADGPPQQWRRQEEQEMQPLKEGIIKQTTGKMESETEMDLKNFAQLKQIAKNHKLKGYSNMKKNQLLTSIKDFMKVGRTEDEKKPEGRASRAERKPSSRRRSKSLNSKDLSNFGI